MKNQDLLRMDYAINSKMNTFFRWVNDYQKEQIQTGIWTGEPFPIQPQLRPKPGSSWSWNLVTTFTPTLASETILAYNHQSQSLSIVGTNPLDRDSARRQLDSALPADQHYELGSGCDRQLRSSASLWATRDGTTPAKTMPLPKTFRGSKGSTRFKFGMYYNRDFKTQTGNWGLEGNINFSSSSSMPNDTGNGLANLMLGNFNNFTQASGHVYPWFRFWELDVYAQDSWKVSKRLTVEYGIRFAHMTPTYTAGAGRHTGRRRHVDALQRGPQQVQRRQDSRPST